MVDQDTFSSEHFVHMTITPSRMLCRQFLEPSSDQLVLIRFGQVTPQRDGQSDEVAKVSLTSPEAFLQVLDCLAFGFRRYLFLW